MAPQAIIILILTTLMVVGAVVFQQIDPVLAEQSFYEVIFFEFITISTIGYGNQYPITRQSRIFSIIFALMGIPLLVVTLGNFGKYLTKFYWKAYGSIFRKKVERQLVNDKDIPLIIIIGLYGLTFLVGFFTIPQSGKAYSVDDTYFSFISFATVGFGDKVPQIDTFYRFGKVMSYLVWGTILNIILINYLTNCFNDLINRTPQIRGTKMEVMIGDQFITVSEITSLVAQQFHASPHQVRSILHDIDKIMEDMQNNENTMEIEEKS
uniref:Potassium channel domain-containing protein n=1 Tax=Caenorhabditis japonica TaxID=281687 RepID=A0A8R1I2U7_CAEJA